MRFTFTLDSDQPEALAAFWAEVLGYKSLGGFGAFWPLVPTDENEPMFVIQQVAEPKQGKNRMHLDLHVDDVDSEVTRLEALGAQRVTRTAVAEHDHQWFVMADPEGNEFCVVQANTA